MTTKPDINDNEHWSAEAEQALDPVLRRAIDWFTVLSDGQADAETIAAHRRWIAADPRQAEAYRKAEILWAGTAQMHQMQKRKTTRRMNRRNFGKLVLLAAFGAGSYGVMKTTAPDFKTASGERRLVDLADGSQIHMSGGTALSVKITETQRNIILHHGEAYFSVARGQAPFSVQATSGRVTALGTKFNIALLNELAEVLVTEHAVRIDYAAQSVTLQQGQKLTYEKQQISAPLPADDQIDLSWLEGRLVFIDKPLSDIVQVLNRWSAEQLILMDSSLAQRPVTLVINIQDIDTVLTQLTQTLPIKTRHIPLWGTLIYSA